MIVPVLNESATIQRRLAALASLRREGVEVIVVDGGSVDNTPARAMPLADIVLHASRGRGKQMNVGAAAAHGEAFLFLHADTCLPASALSEVTTALSNPDRHWGRFDVAIQGEHPLLPVVAAAMNTRSRLTGIATGDQAIFVRRNAFVAAGGFPPIALMEDIALSAALRRISRPACLCTKVTTSGRRWDANGFWRTVLLMWWLRLAFWLGVPPRVLARWYGYG